MKSTDLHSSQLLLNQDLLLTLIRKELLDAKLISDMSRLGFDSSIFSADLGVVILSLVGFTNRTGKLWDWYYQTLNSYAEQIDIQDNSIIEEISLNLYTELRVKRKEALQSPAGRAEILD